MRISSTVITKASPQAAWKFLADPFNTPKWDRSIAKITIIKNNDADADSPPSVGTIIETTSPSGNRQSFQITAYEFPNKIEFKLLDSSIFKVASLRFLIANQPYGTRIIHELDMTLRLRAFFLYPVLAIVQKKALATDLEYLRRALDEGYDRQNSST